METEINPPIQIHFVGLDLASRSALPEDVLQRAHTIRQTLSAHNEVKGWGRKLLSTTYGHTLSRQRLAAETSGQGQQQRATYKLVSRLIQVARDATVNPEQLRPFLKVLQDEYQAAA